MTTITDAIVGVLREHRRELTTQYGTVICCCQWIGVSHPVHVAEAIAAAVEPIIQRKAVLAEALAADALHEGEEARIRALELRGWIAEWPCVPGDGSFLGEVARAGLARADQHEGKP